MIFYILGSFQEDLTPDSTLKVLKALKNGTSCKIGPQTHRQNCEGPQRQTTLLIEPKGPGFKVRDGL